MLETLRKMSPGAKKKVVAVCAGFLTLVILGLWGLHSFGALSSALESTKNQGVAVFNFLDQNVERAYNAFKDNAPKFVASTTDETATSIDASSTEMINIGTTTEQ